METLSIHSLLKYAPTPIAMVDTNLNFLNYSYQWNKLFVDQGQDIIGLSFFNVIKDYPSSLKEALRKSLLGHEHRNQGQKFTLPNGELKWLKWKVIPFEESKGNIGGTIIFLEDVTHIKRELELSSKVGKTGKIGGWEVNLLSNNIYWNEATKNIHEVSPDYVPNLETGINFYKKGPDRDKITELISLAIEKGTGWDVELIIITANGNEKWVRAKGETELLNGKCVRIFGTFQDIDEKKKAELKYNAISERLKIATNAANIGIWEYDIDTNTVSANDNMYAIYGIESKVSNLLEEWINRIHIDDRDRIRQEFGDTVQKGTPFVNQFKAIKKGGETIYVAAFGEAQKDAKGNIIGVIGSNLDITALRHTELKLKRSNESFSEIFKNSAIGMAMVDKDNYWLKANETLCTSLGYTEEELQKMTVTDLTHPDDLEKSLKYLNSGKNSYQIEKRYFHKDGHIVHVILAVTLVKDLDNKISHSIAQILDLTERLEATKQLNTLVNVTKAQNESLMNFAHIVSHNLRSHSSNMNMLTSFMATEKDPEEIVKLNGMISDASSSLSDTVADLNNVVQIQTGALDQLKSVSLLNAFNKAKNSITALIEKEEAVFLVNISKSHFVNAVPSYLESILLNLITNSLKYKAPDRNPVLQITSAVKEDMIHITFTDNGQGIDLDRHGDKIFGMYKTFHKHKDAKGIGLFITKNQIENMRGKIYLESEVGKYTTVHIELKQG